MLTESHLFFLGAGAISEAIINGLTSTATVPASRIAVCNRGNEERLRYVEATYGVSAALNRRAALAAADIVVLAVKPLDVRAVLDELGSALTPHQLLVSVAAGVTTAALERRLPDGVPVIRAMPNTSSRVQASATALCPGRWATPDHLARASQLFAAIGTATVVPEAAMNAVTGLAGTGPAYIYYVVEALQAGGEATGLTPETCRELLLQTLTGAVAMLRETALPPAELRRQVTSPNGTTMAGVGVLEAAGVHDALHRAVLRATERAGELGQALE